MNISGKSIRKLAFFAALTACAFIINACGESFGNLKSQKELMNYKNDQASLVLSENGELIGKFFSENRTNVSYKQIPSDLINALIATEDVRFFEHKGNDTRSLFRVLVKTIFLNDRSSGGGSTITQQLAKNMYGRKHKGPLFIFVYKIKEAIIASRLEKVYTKEEILTMYLNTVPFGENVYGIEAASMRFFSKNIGKLKIEESAVLIGMLKANTLYNPRMHPENAKSRRNVVIRQMEKYKYISTAKADSLCKLPMVLKYSKYNEEGMVDYFLVQVRNETEQILDDIHSATGETLDPEKDGLVITTTLNLQLQKYAVRSFREHLSVMQKRLKEQYQSASGKKLLEQITDRELKRLGLTKQADVKSVQDVFDWDGPHSESISIRDSLKNSLTLLHAGMLAIDPQTGAVKAWVGGIDFRTQPYDQVLARRQLASTFKPVIYTAALEDGMDPCQYLDNDSVTVSGFDDWSPENYDHSYGGKYSLAGALAHSMNVPTFCLFMNIGFEKVNSIWEKMGFSFRLDNTPSLAMGTAEASIKEIASGYSAFVNGGFTTKPQCVVSVKTSDGKVIYKNDFSERSEQIISERTCILMESMLQKAVREGTGATMSSVYGVTLPLAGKTGTSQNYADAWFTALNPKLVMVARAGASTQAIHFNSGSNGSGSTLALPLVGLTLQKVQQNPSLSEKLIAPFPDLPPDLEGALDCPDIKEKNVLDKVRDLFKNEKGQYDNDDGLAAKRIRSLIERIFKKEQ
ncbi:MAG: transglycosylase domain-containing protein [Bacteroidales bacterium]|nr:transglycosylase domain-containing protein [Bacteroidales bacterium]